MKNEAVFLIGFGGPENPSEIRPFLDHVLAGRSVPTKRYEAVVSHYEAIGGKSPYNEMVEVLGKALSGLLAQRGRSLPVFTGFLHTPPFLGEIIRKMHGEGIERIVALILSPYRSEPSYERYVKGLQDALERTGTRDLEVLFPPPWYWCDGFIEAWVDRIWEVLSQQKLRTMPPSSSAFVFSAHSIPVSLARQSSYEQEIRQTAERIMQRFPAFPWHVVYQSRSGNPHEPWLEPDINDFLRDTIRRGTKTVVIVPVGFLFDHLEVLYDLDREARRTACEGDLDFVRVPTVMDHPRFVHMLADLVLAEIDGVKAVV